MGEMTLETAHVLPTTRSLNTEPLDIDDPLLISSALCVQGREDEAEVGKVVRALCTWGDKAKLRRLLASAFVSPLACASGMCEAAKLGHDEIVRELLRARASPQAADGKNGKTALHFACEEGHEEAAKCLLSTKAISTL